MMMLLVFIVVVMINMNGNLNMDWLFMDQRYFVFLSFNDIRLVDWYMDVIRHWFFYDVWNLFLHCNYKLVKVSIELMKIGVRK